MSLIDLVSPSRKEGLFDIVTLLRFIDEAVIGTFNTIVTDAGQVDRKIDCYPYKSDQIEQLTGAIPDDGTARRILTYRVRKAGPATLSGGTKDLTWRHRETVQAPAAMNGLGTPIAGDILGKWIDYKLRFDCFAPTWQESQRLALEVEDLFDICTKYITSKGLVKLVYEGRSADIYHMKTAYHYENLSYMARIERLKVETGETFQELFSMFDSGLMGIIR